MLGKSGMKRLIIGFDPGVTVGLAALTLDGVPVFVDSRRDWSFSSLLRTVADLGACTVVSSDVSPPSEVLERLSAKLNAVLFAPLISMGAEEKHQIARAYEERYSFKVKNAHEVDALAAAVKAYQHYRNKFEQVEVKLKTQGFKVSVDDVKDLVARDHTMKQAVQILQGIGEYKPPPVPRKMAPREEQMKSLIEELRKQLAREKERSKRLKATNEESKLRTRDLKTEIANLKARVEEIRSQQSAQVRREREYQLLQDELIKAKARLAEYSAQLEAYRNRFNQMQRLRELESQGRLVLLKPVEAFTENGLRKAFELYSVKAGDSVFLLDPSGGGAATAETLAKRGVKAVVTNGSMSHQALEVFAKYLIPVLPSERVKIEWIEGLPYADAESLRRAARELSDTEASKAYEEIRTILEDHRREIREE